RSRIAIGQVFLLMGVLWMATAMGLVPSQREAVLAGRGKICEAIAVFGSAFVESGDMVSLDASLRAVAARNPDILSQGLRREDGTILIQIGDHFSKWDKVAANDFAAKCLVPITDGNKRWGKVEVQIQRTETGGFLGWIKSPQVKLIA